MNNSVSCLSLLPIEYDLENWKIFKDIPLGGKFEVDLNLQGDRVRISKGSNQTCLGWAIQSVHRAVNKKLFNTLAEIGPLLEWLQTFRHKTVTDLLAVSDSVKREAFKTELAKAMADACYGLENLKVSYLHKWLGNQLRVKDLIDQEQEILQRVIDHLTSKQTKQSPLLWAIEQSNQDLLGLLIQLGADPNFKGNQPYSPLEYAIYLGLSKQQEIVPIAELLLSNGAKLDLCQDKGKNLLQAACQAKQKGLIDLLEKYGLHIDTLKNEFLVHFAKDNRPDVIEFLVNHYQVDINSIIKIGNEVTTAWLEAKMGGHAALAKKLEEEFGAKTEFGQGVLNLKFFGHVMGLKGSILFLEHEVRLEALTVSYCLEKMIEFVDSPLLDDYSFLSQDNKHLIRETFKLAKYRPAPTEIIKRIQSGKPFILLGGFQSDTVAHVIAYVFCQNKLFVCNKGAGKNENGITVYALEASEMTEPLLAQFGKGNYSNAADLNFFIKSLNLSRLNGIYQKEQKVGNCAWASTKSAFYALLVALTHEPISAGVAPQCRAVFKDFTRKIRKLIYNEVNHDKLVAKITNRLL